MVDFASQPNNYPTRTVAIIKPHALPNRLDIERRIIEAGFEIAKERQMMFSENDRDVEDLFGVNNALALGEGPCWVYVLERRRAVEVLKTLMGDEDPEDARQSNANSLRALYGVSIKDNVIFGSPDATTAEHQISMLFASSPPFRTTELPEDPAFPDRMGSLRSITSSVLNELNLMNGDESAATNTTKSISSKASVNGKSSTSGSTFRARPVPSSIAQPTIKPRLSHAAALRAGLVQPKVSIWSEGPRKPLSEENRRRTFANVPGHKRAESIQVASTAPPTIAPRMTRAASLRQGVKDVTPAPTKPRKKNPEAVKKTFEGVPGHKRRETLSVASVAPPTVAPRQNRAAALRADKDKAPPSSYMFRTPSGGSQVTSTAQSRRPSITSRPSSALQSNPPPATRRPSTAPSRPASVTLVRSSTAPTPIPRRAPSTTPGPPPASIRKPVIEPRQNRSALLRARKLEGAKKEDGKINGKPVFV